MTDGGIARGGDDCCQLTPFLYPPGMQWTVVFLLDFSGFLGENVVPLWAELNFDLKMGTIKTCRIFLASSVDEMKKQRTDFGDFIRDFADIYRPRGVDITLVKCEDLRLAYSGRPTQDVLDEEVAQSDVLVTLFYKKCGKDTVREFEVGWASLAARKKPIIIVALKNTKARTPELDAFTSKLSDELHMYYWRFGTTDKLHFDFVMWFLQSEFAVGGDPVTVENGTVKAGDLPVAQLSQLPFAANNTEYQRLEQQLTALEKDIEKLRQKIKKYPDDEDFSRDLSQKYLAREALQQEFQRQQDALLGAAKRIAEMRKQQVSEKLAKAADAFENGQLEVANTYLDELEHEGDQLFGEIQSRREELKIKDDQLHDHIEGLRLQTQTVMADASIPIGERISQVAAIYAKADKWAAASNYPEEKYEKLLFDYARFLYDYARYPEAVEVYLRQIALSEKLYGTDHSDTATSYNNIGLVYDKQGAYAQALEYYNKALEIYKKVLGEDHPYTATSYNNIGAVYKAQGAYAQALEYYKKALVIKKKVLDENHPSIATSYNNIGWVYKTQGAYAQALEYYNKALAIKKKVLDENHPSIATSYNNIGAVYDAQGVYAQALEFYNKALAIREKVLGKDHPSTATSYNNIGLVYDKQGAYAQALEYYNKALEIYKKVLGEDHPYTASSYNNIGAVYQAQGAYSQALDYYNKALAIDEKVLGKDHPGTATDYNNIGWVYMEQGDYKQALEYFEKAFTILQQKLGDDHPYTRSAKRSIEVVKGKLAGNDGYPWWRRLLSGLFGK